MSHVRTSSFAGTTARPAPVEREEDKAVVGSAHQTALEVAEQMTPKVWACSQRLYTISKARRPYRRALAVLQIGFDHGDGEIVESSVVLQVRAGALQNFGGACARQAAEERASHCAWALIGSSHESMSLH